MIEVGTVIGGRFRVDRVLGAGGMGVVVGATHLELGQQVALKVLHDELATNPTIVARFLREARAVAQLRTDHVCRVFDVGRLDSGAPFIVMEMLNGSDLGSVVQRGPVAMVIAVEYVIQSCVALAEAHAAGVVHRDLKPANLFVVRRPDGGPLVKVLDFGIAKAATAAEAKLTHTTSTMGSPGYMSPEQIRSTRDVDVRTDIWALGVTLYQLLTGRMPFHGTQLAEIAVAVMTAAPAPLETDPNLVAVVMRCLEKEPERRYQTVQELAIALMPFGGPSAPRFVSEITRGQVGMAAPPQSVSITAPTAASYATRANEDPATNHTAPSPPQIAAPTQASDGKGTWIVLGVVLVAVLVGGGALAGYLARGGSGSAREDAGVVAIADASAQPAAHDAPVSIDAQAVIDASAVDPWSVPGGEVHEGGDEDDDMPSIPAIPKPRSTGMLFGKDKAAIAQQRALMKPYRDQALLGLRASEPQLGMIKQYDAPNFDAAVSSYTQMCCLYEDKALAQKFYGWITNPEDRADAKAQCEILGITLVDGKKAM